jgi:DnaJ-class molecular chaperone
MGGDRNQAGGSASSGPKLNSGDEAKPGTPGTGENVCPDCRGSGRMGAQACKTCGGTGKVTEGIGGG